MTPEQVLAPPTRKNSTSTRYVIWEGVTAIDNDLPLIDLLARSGIRSLRALHGMEANPVSPFTAQIESLLLQHDIGVVAHAYWPVAETTENLVPGSVLEQSVQVLQLSVRPSNCLLNAGIGTIRELLQRSQDDLLRIPNMGRKSLDEIRRRLSEVAPGGVSSPLTEEAPVRSFSLALLLPFETCGIPPDTAARLRASRILDVVDLVAKDIEVLRSRAKLELVQLQTLQTTLLRHRLRLGWSLPRWIKDRIEDHRSAFREDAERILGARDVVSFETPIRQLAPWSPSCLEQELEALLSPRAREKSLPIVRRVLGWDGGAGATLEAAGQEFGLTRERVRQIIARGLQNRPSPVSSFLNRAIKVISEVAPCTAEQAERALLDQEIVRSPIRVEGVLATARALDIDVPWRIQRNSSSRVIVGPSHEDRIADFIREAKRRISRYGATTKSFVLEALAWRESPHFADLCCAMAPGLVWLDEPRGWFWLPTARNAIAARLMKILRVAPAVEIMLALEGVLRDRRMEGAELPVNVFRNFCSQMPWCTADEECIRGVGELPQDEETDSNEVIICRVLQEHGPVMWRRDLWRRANDLGVEKVSFDRHLSESNALVRLAPEVYGLIGASGMPHTKAEDRAVSQFPVEPEAPIAEAFDTYVGPSSFLAGCDPGAPDFPIHMLKRTLSRSAALRQRGVWSLVELEWSDEDLEAIRTWSQVGTFEMREVRRESVTYGSARFDGVEALALLFLACCSDIAMVRADETEMWPTIQSTFGLSLRARLFQGPANPNVRIREATERVCSRLRIRHVFGREGEQSWRRTVFLQFGITRSGWKRLPWWLSGASVVPVAVEELLSSPALRSNSFGEFWRTLQRYRAGQLTHSQCVSLLRVNAWVRNTDIDDLLCAATERRDVKSRQEADVETATEDADYLFDVPRLSWRRDSPVFELPLRKRSRWLTEPRYVLVLGNGKRIPVTLREGEYRVDTEPEVDLTEEVVTVDLRRGQISCIPQPIDIRLAPLGYDFVFYDLSTGEPLVLGNERIAPGRPVALLAKSTLELPIEALEMRRVFDGTWIIRAYRNGVPADFEIRRDGRTIWAYDDIRHASAAAATPRLRVTCAGGQWGEPASFKVHHPPDVTPTHLLFCGMRIQLNRGVDGTYCADVPLTPSLGFEDLQIRVEVIWRERVRWFGATLEIGQVSGIAIEAEDGWKVLKESSDVDASFLGIRRIVARLPAHFDGDRVSTADWAWMEGSHFCGRPRNAPMLLGTAVHAVGEPLLLSVGPYNQSREGRVIARSVIHSGVIAWIEQTNDGCYIHLRRNLALGSEHGVWIWPSQSEEPHLLSRAEWRQEGDACTLRVHASTTPIAFAISFQGAWLGARTCERGWAGLIDVLRSCKHWQLLAQWLKWWRVPLLHPALKPLASELVKSQPVATIQAWVSGNTSVTIPVSSDEHEESWRTVTRMLLWDWAPTPADAAMILRNCGLLTGNLEDDSRLAWDGYEELLAVQPILLAQLAARGAALLYSHNPTAVRGLLEALRDSILAVEGRSRQDDVSRALREAKAMAAEAMAVDDAFVSKSLLRDAIDYAKGRLNRSSNLRIALANSYAVPQYLAACVIDKVIAGEIVI